MSPPRWVQTLSVTRLAPLPRAVGRPIDDLQLLTRAIISSDPWPGIVGARAAELVR